MLKRHTIILLMLTFLSASNLFGQDKLRDNIVGDSIIRKLKIKQVTENWFHDSLKTPPANTTIEKYNEIGQKTQRVHINYFYHKFIDDYEYNLKKNAIVETKHYYDWNPYREKRKGDTIVKKKVSKYDMNSGRRLKTKPSSLEEFQPRLKFDSMNRITERIDTIKCGYNIIYYNYDKNNKVVERKHYTSHHSENPCLFTVDSLHYNLSAQLMKETNYYDIKVNEDNWSANREAITTYKYYQNGLIHEKTNVTKYQSLKNEDYKPTIYRYEYEYY